MVVDLHTILAVTAGLLSLFTGIFVLSRNPKSQMHQSYFMVGLFFAIWQLMYFIGWYVNRGEITTQFWHRLGYAGVNFLPIVMFDYVVKFLNLKKIEWWSRLNYFYGLVIAYLIINTDYIMSGLLQYSWGVYPKAGPWHPVFLVYFNLMLTFVNIFLFIWSFLKKGINWRYRNQIRYIFIAFFIACLGDVDFLPNYGQKFYPLNFYPTGYLTTFTCFMIIAFAIVKHKLMDINIIIKKGFVYSILITTLTFMYLTFVLAFEQLFKGMVGYQGTYGSVTITLMIAIIFNPLKNRIESMVERTLFKGTAAEIAAQNELLRQQIAQSERYKTIAALTSNIVDEIKDPLTALQGYNHFLDKRKDDPEFMEKFKEKTTSEFAKINELLQHLTAYSNPTPLSTQNTQMVKLLNETVGLLKSNLMEANIELTKNFRAPEALQLNVDPSQLRQSLSNIIMNSIEAMPMGGELTIETDEVEDRFRITIRDTGPGIPKENLGKVCDPFFTKKEKHSGLGLSIAQGIIENHNGKIRIKSETGQGVEIVLDLPIG